MIRIIKKNSWKIGQMTQSELVQHCKYVANELIIDSLDLLSQPEKFTSNEGGNYNMFPTREDVKAFYKNKKRFF